MSAIAMKSWKCTTSLNNKIPTVVVAITDNPDHNALVIAIPVLFIVNRRRYPTAV